MTSALDGDSMRVTDWDRDRDRELRHHARLCGKTRGGPATNCTMGGSAGGAALCAWVAPSAGALWHDSIPTGKPAIRLRFLLGWPRTRTSPSHREIGWSRGEELRNIVWYFALSPLSSHTKSRHVRVGPGGTRAWTHGREHHDVPVRNDGTCRVGLLRFAGEYLSVCVQVLLKSGVRRGCNRASCRPCQPNVAGECVFVCS